MPVLYLFVSAAVTAEPVAKESRNQSWHSEYFLDAWIDYYSFRETHDIKPETEDNYLRARVRIGTKLTFSNRWQAQARIAGRYHNQMAKHTFSIQPYATSPTGMAWGHTTVDTFSATYASADAWRLTLGRFQTSHGLKGVLKKSLDRADGRPKVSWTDGASLWIDINEGWRSRFIVEYNSAEGPSNVKRRPLNADNWSLFSSIEAKSNWGPIVQRALDITYIPQASENSPGDKNGIAEDYIALVARMAAQWSVGDSGQTILLGAEIGYTPGLTGSAIDSRDISERGQGKIISVSVNNILPSQSVGVSWGRANNSWLISPDLAPDEDFLEFRYRWQLSKKMAWEFDIKRRRDLTDDASQKNSMWLRYRVSF
ncbi:hypothetical protein R50073_08570 [Maricurvus nonylphenolicus]|uniref:hypothetical protein n=1 Tax=Maricurvus nonylphenolicus TaxID=1008307 RepID=UPI0036F22A96